MDGRPYYIDKKSGRRVLLEGCCDFWCALEPVCHGRGCGSIKAGKKKDEEDEIEEKG